MQTIKIPYTTSVEGKEKIIELMKEYSPVIRSSYCRFLDGMKQKDVRDYLKSTFPNKDSWYLQSAIYEAIGMSDVDTNQKRTRLFGGKLNFIKRKENKISNEEWKACRLLPLSSVGEAPQKGNRKFKFDMMNNRIIFKINRHTHVPLQLPKLRRNYKDILWELERLSDERKCPISFKIDDEYLYISFERMAKEKYEPISSRYAGIDLNPNAIGFVIYDNGVLVYSKLYKLNELTSKSNEASSHSKSKYKTNKLTYETAEIAKDIANICEHYKVNCLSIEDINIKSSDKGKGKNFNRTCNNVWKRKQIKELLIKRCKYIGIKSIMINPAYSSYIGNINNPHLPDPLASASEVARRGYECKILKNGQFYPKRIPSKEDLSNRWKEVTDWSENYLTWKELCGLIKNSKIRYRVPIPDGMGLRFKSIRSKITHFSINIYN